MKKAKILCSDTNITTDHSCGEYLNFLVDEDDIKKAIPTAKAQIQTHYSEFVDRNKLENLSDETVEKMLVDWGNKEKIQISEN